MKNFLKILFINILIFILLLFVLDFLLFFNRCSFYKCIEKKTNPEKTLLDKKSCIQKYFSLIKSFNSVYKQIKRENKFRKQVNVESNKKPIIIFGCSFAYGENLKENQTFSYKIAMKTKRPVYNRAMSSWSVQHMLFQLQNEIIFKNNEKPEFIIYVFMSDHMRRMFVPMFFPTEDYYNLRYLKKGNTLILEDINKKSLRGLYIKNLLEETYVIRCKLKQPTESFDTLKLMLKESKKEAEKKYSGVKFVVLKYMNVNNYWYLNTNRWQELEKEGFIILDTKKLTRKDLSKNEYKQKDNIHPNEKAWDIIVPALIKELNL